MVVWSLRVMDSAIGVVACRSMGGGGGGTSGGSDGGASTGSSMPGISGAAGAGGSPNGSTLLFEATPEKPNSLGRFDLAYMSPALCDSEWEHFTAVGVSGQQGGGPWGLGSYIT